MPGARCRAPVSPHICRPQRGKRHGGPPCAPRKLLFRSSLAALVRILPLRSCRVQLRRGGALPQRIREMMHTVGSQPVPAPATTRNFFAGGHMLRSTLLTLVFLAGIGLTAGCGALRGRGDDAVATDIKAKMFSDASLKSANLSVSVKDGVATLSGNVPDDAARLAAYKIASDTPGVSKVNDQMSVLAARAVSAPSTAPAAAKPSAPPSAPRHSNRAKSSHAKPAPPAEVAEAAAPPPPAAQNVPAEEPSPKPVPLSPPPPPPPQPKTVTLQVGSVVTVRTIDSIDSKQNHTGQMFKASLDAPIVIDNE